MVHQLTGRKWGDPYNVSRGVLGCATEVTSVHQISTKVSDWSLRVYQRKGQRDTWRDHYVTSERDLREYLMRSVHRHLCVGPDQEAIGEKGEYTEEYQSAAVFFPWFRKK